ncbi:VCBS domain-containing protein [Shewanella xiamenensis]|uniref:VCBS domain-containing protein n=1 Tax=Shewanella xiamenensis TaxID=332186 RepID=UPI0024A6DB7B|nr:VCBS domain-containing protein [Shewanella xiamenensis]MDI5848813.1 VCBS domain-containing protein [Shewanella xiamenensis]
MSPKKPLTLSTAKRKSRISAKLAKKSEIAAKKLDKDVAKLKAKEFRESEVQNSATPDIVATQSWRLATHATTQLANTEQSTEQKSNSQSTTADIDNRHSTTQSASTDSEKTLLEQQQQANAAETQTATLPKFQDYGSSESTHLGQGLHVDDTQPLLVTLSQLPEIRDIKQQIEPTALTVSMARTTLTQSVRPPIISTEQHHTPLSIDEQVTHQSIKEDAPAASISGKLHAHGETIMSLQWTVAEHQGQFGRLDIDPITGEWHYQLDNNAPNTDALAEGEHQTEQFTVTVSGPNGEQVSTVIVIDVEGSNDLPQILGSHLASINAADSLQTVMGQLRSVDPDHNDVITWAVLDGQGQYGQLSINPLTGQWQYQLNNHANATLALVSGQQVTETFTVTATDQSGHPVSQQVSIQVNGADDAAIIQGEMTGLVTEDTQAINGQLTVSGQLSIQDPDKDQAHFSADSLQGQFGYLTIDVNGHWIYNADNTQATIQSLRSGEHLTDTFIIHSADGTAQNITVTINGTDDKAEISGTTSASLTEDSDTYQGMLRANGNLTITDNDHGPHLFTATEQSGQFGTFTIDELGHWTYIADNSQTEIQALKTGESITDTLVVQTQDGTQQTISITIHGTDDHSVIRGTSVVRVFEDKRLSQGQLHTDGQLWVSNPDTGRAGFAAEQRQGQFGVLSISSDGHWTYIADNNNPSIQALKHGEFVTETLFVKALDGTSQKIEILIKGADDKAIIGGTDTATLIEDQSVQHGQLQAHGTLTITDPDAGQAQFTALTDIAGSAGYGHFSIDATGNWTYTANNTLTAIQQLNTGEHLTDSLTISSADGTNHTLTVTITGSNDAPVVAQSLVTTTATEDTAFSFSIPAGTFADIDTGDTLILSTGSLPAWLHFDAATGTFSGTPTNGDVGTSQVTITATDGSGAQVSTIFVLNVGNTNDAPTLTHIATVNATEDGAQVTGQFTATDPDSGDTLTFSIAQPVDGLTVNTDGSWRFDPSHASYQHLAAGQTLTLTMPVTVTDAAGATSIQDLVIKLNGSNDGATIGGVSTGSAKEDNAQITTGQLIVADVDDGEAHFVAQTDTAGTYGHFSLSADGRWSYQLDNSKPEIQQLSEGVMLHENFNVHSADGTTHTIIVDIVGTNDAPVLAAQSQSVTEDGNKLSGQMVATDVDTGDSQTFSTTAQTAGFTLNADGSYSFAPANAAYQHLAAGQTETLTIPITVTDSTGATSTANLTITLTGSNDGAIISGTDASAVTEDTQLTTQGQLTVTDIDDQESAFTAQANTAGSYGSFTLAADGHWTYTLDNKNSAVQALGQNGTLTDSLTAQSVDGTTHTVTVTINGHDDGAVIAGVDSGAVTEDANLTAGQLETRGQLTISDPDAGQDHFTAQPHVAGSYGTFSLDQAGHWTYVSDNSQTAIQQLKAGETLTDSLTVQSVGGTTHTVTVTLTGSNDVPVLTAQSQSVTEDGSLLTGQMVATDVDTGDTFTFSLANAVNGFTLNADGSYSFDPSNAAYQHLAAGQTQTLTIPVSVTDSAGATSTANLTITLTGSNDGALISGTDTGAVTEDTQLTTQGQLTVTDIDDQESAFTAQANTAGSYGSFTLVADGHWTYTLDNSLPAVQALGQNATLTDSLTVQSVDGTTHKVTVTINGHDDGAVIAGVDSGTVTEDSNVKISGLISFSSTLTVSDIDTGEARFPLQQGAGSLGLGNFLLAPTGGWGYSVDNNLPEIQQLKAGQTLVETYTFHSADGSQHTVTVTITGSNDAPVLTAQRQSVTEDGTKLSGQMVATDVDTSDSQTFSTTAQTAGFTLNADGSYSFDPANAAYQHLAAGQTQTLTIPVSVTDSAGATATQQLVITVTGSNDGAIISGTDASTVTEDTQLTTQGQLTVTDIDDQESAFTAQANTAGSYGSFTLAADGHWTYTLDNKNSAVQALGQNATLTDSLTVQSVDGTTHAITVTINGHDDGALIAGVDSGTVTEDSNVATGKITTSGQLTISDPDAGQDHFTAQTNVAGSYGTFSLNADGQWRYSADNSQTAIQQLKAGATLTDSFTVTSADGTNHTVTVTLTGSNDAPVLTAQSQSVTEDGSRLSGQMVATDVDQGDTLHFSIGTRVAGFTLNADGSYSFDPSNAAYQYLAQGQTQTLTIPVSVTDSTGATSTANLTITLTGTNDGATLTDHGTPGQIKEDLHTAIEGHLSVRDVDSGEGLFPAQQGAGLSGYGSFVLTPQANGQAYWRYSVDNSKTEIQQLGEGQLLHDSFTVHSADGTTHTISVDIVGTNDVPVLTAQSQSVTEDGSLLTGQMVATDMDTGDTLTFSLANSVDGFTLNADGSYSFDPSNAAYQHLVQGQTETLSIPITVTDSAGATSTANLTITLTGSNDGAIISGTDASAVTEDTQLTTSGQLTVTDIDDQESAFTAQAKTAGSYGSFTLAADGHWTYTLDNSLPTVQALGQNATLTDSLTVQSVDGTTHTITVTINGHDDGAVIAGVDSGTVTEDANLTAGQLETHGQLTISDPDAGQDHFTAQTHVAGSYGTFSLDADGQWNYSADNSQTAIQQLKAGETLTDSLTVQSVGGTTHTVTITLTGSNDAPVLTAQSQSVTEDGSLLTGQMVATDVDIGDSQTFSTTAQTAGFTLNADGSYSFDPTDAAYQHLAAGQTQTLTIPVSVTDSAGATATQQLVITVTGSNDGAVISGTDAGAVTEDMQLTTGGQLTVTDIDDQESAFTAQANTAGSYGSFTLAADGHWTYTLDNKNSAVQALGQNATLTDSLTVQSVDGTTHTVTVTINGHDDGAVIAGVDSGTVTEDANLTAGQLETHGQLTISDPDAGQDHFTAQTNVAGSYGTFSLDADGQWHYSADNSQTAIQQLKAGETLTDSLTVQSVGGTTHTVTITLTGSNDAPVLTAQSQSVTEDGSLLTGQMVATDVDTGDSQTFSTSAQTAGFTLNADGSYSFEPIDAAYQHLAQGQTETLTIPVSVTDSAGATSTQQLVITVTGSNDGAVISGIDAGTVTEDSQLTTQGQLTVTDIDDQESAFTAQSNTAGSYGSFTLAADGHWTYTLDNSLRAVQALGQNTTLTDSLTVQSVDGTTHTVTVTINGHDDGAVIAGVDSGTVTEDANLTAGQLETRGQLTISDPDAGQDHFTAQTHVAGSYGTFSLDADGQWNYSADNSQTAIQQLKAGETLTDSLTVQSVGGTTHTVTITLTGSNDAPVLTAQSQSVTEDGSLLTGQMVATDVDIGDTLTFSLANAVDGFTLNADGSYSFDPSNAAYQHLAAGQTQTLTIPVSVTDSAGATATQQLVITVTGSNDVPVLTAQSQSITEDGAKLTGQMVAKDVDTGDSQTFSTTAQTAGFTLNADGSYSFDPSNAAYQHLAAGQTQTLTIPVSVTDSAGATSTANLTITLTGSNDGAVISGTDTGAVTEDTQLTTQGQLTVTDIDDQESAFTAQANTAGSYGSFTLAADGHWTYTLDNKNSAVQALGQNATLTDSLTVQSVDGTTHTVTVTINGHDDGAVIAGVDSGAVTEDSNVTTGKISTSGQLTISDPDAGQDHFTAQTHVAGSYGTFSLDADGQWHYSADNSQTAIQQLKAGATLTDNFTVTSADGTNHTVTVTLTGSNDAPVLTAQSQSVTEDGSRLSGQMVATDVDQGDTLHFSIGPRVAGFTLNADGSYNFDPSNAAYQHLAAGQTQTLTIPVTVTDSAGASSTQNLTITLTGTNDGATLTDHGTPGQIKEDLHTAIEGHLSVRDVDSGEGLFPAQQGAGLSGYGSFVLTPQANGQAYWRYSVDNSKTEIQQLGEGQLLHDSFTVHSADGTTHTISVDIVGTNDAPVLTAQSQSVTEDGSLLTGQMVATDVDTGDTLTFSLANSVDGFTLNADGSYSFAPANAAYQHLAAGQTQTLTIPVSVTDSAGATSTANLTITLTGSNDGALISGTDAGTVTEDTQLTTGGQLTVTDIDDQESAFTAQANTAGSYGSFTLAADGHWTYTLDNKNSAVQALGQNATLTDSLTVQSVDGTTHTVTVTINGHDDGAVIAGVDSGTVTEDANLTAGQLETHGQLTISDPDAGQDHFTAQTNVAGSYGTFSLDADGQWHYSADNSQTAIQQLKAGETLTDSLTVQSVGGTTHTVTITLTGSNDAPVLTAQSQSVTEDGAKLTGQMVATDVDTGDTLSFSLANGVDGFTLNTDGSYSFDPSNAAYQHLTQGQTQNLTIPVTVTDSAGATSTQNLTLNLTGSNDGAVIGGDISAATTEDSTQATRGRLTITDADDGEAHFVAQSNTAGTYGSFTLLDNGQWSYQLDNSKHEVQALKDGQQVTDTFTVTSADGGLHQVTVTITGKNDAAVITGEDHQTLTEDQNVSGGQLIAHGQLHASTPDAGGDQFTPLQDLAGKFGQLSLSAGGSWVYKADNSSPAVQALHAGQSATESFTVHSVDGTAHTISINIQGADESRHDILSSIVSTLKSNWAPFKQIGNAIDARDAGSLGNVVLSFYGGNPHVVDADGHVLASGSNKGMFGYDISLGQVVGLLKSHPGAQLVLDGQTGASSSFYLHDSGNSMQLTFAGNARYNVHDNTLGSVPIDGLPTPLSAAGAVLDVSDSLTISVTDIRVDHAGQLQTSGQLNISDADAGENHFNAQKDVAGTYGSFSIDASGHWVYSVDNGQAAVQNLQAGAQLTDSFMVMSADGTSHVVSVAVYGKNDAPVLFAQSQSVSEDGAQLSGQMHASDVDAGDTQTFSIDQPVAGFALKADGSYSFDPSNAAYQHLAEGQTETLTIPITVTDHMGASSVRDLTITLTGKNDAAVITGVDQRTVTEDQDVDGFGNLHVTGQLQVDDPDGNAGPLQFQQQNAVQASYGHFTLNADGYWLYEADNKNPAIQQLKTGESLTDTLTAHSADGTSHTITVTIQGQDDAAAFVPQAQAAQVSSSDVYTIIGVQLMSSEHREFQFMAEVLLGNTDPRSYVSAEMSFTNTSVALRAPDGSLASVYHAAGGMTTVPLMDLRNWHNKGQGYDVVLVDATGMPVNVFPHDLGDPDKMSGFNQYVTGFSGPFNAAVVLYPDTQAASSGGAVQGSAVVPAMAPVLYDAAHVLEDNGQQISGFIEVQDADQGQSSMQPMTDHHAAHGTFSIDVNGDWVYQLDSSRPDVQALKDGETLIDTITVHSADGTPHKVNITIHGQADGAVISGADTGRVIEDQQVTAAGLIETQGQLLLSDPDAGEEVFVAQANAAGKYGVFSFDEDGHWRYSADSSQAVIQQLKAGAALSDIFTVHSADGTAHTVSVMITGSNDAPVLTAQSQAYDQGGAQYRGQMSATDADAGDALHFSTTTTVAGFTLHADGSYQFDPSDAAYQHLASGQSQNVVIPITVTDSAGATSTQNLTFTVTSAAHGAVISGVDSGSMIEDGSSAVASGQLSIVDPDAGEAHFLAQANVSGQHGHFSLLENGAWTYTLDNKDAAVQALKAGESLTEHLTVSSVDGTTHVLTVTVQGSNDAPVLQAQSQSVTEDGSLLHGKMVAQDGDHGDALRFSTPNAVGGFTLNADGSYSFDPCHHDYQSLGAGQTRDIAIPITVTDSAGATATQMLNVHITGRDDRTSIYGVDSGSVQAGVHPETSGDLHASDDDAGQSGFRAGTVNGSFGRLSIDAQGHWTYWVDGSDPFVMHLLPNSHITEQLTVHSVDGTAHDIEIEVSGPPGGGQLNAPVDNVNVQYVALPQVWDAYQAQTGVNKGGHEVFAGILAAVRAGGYQYQGLADELDKGNLAVVSNMDVSISGVHVQVVDAFGHLVQNFSPTTENAATLHMSDVLNWHAQGYSILASSDSGLDSVRLWLHNTGDMHNIQVQLPSGTGFNAWADQWTFGELQFHAQTSSQSSDEANFETIDSVNLDVAEPATLATSAHDLDLASSGHLNVSSVNYDASLLVGSVDEQTAQTNPAQDKSVDTTLFEGGNFSAQATTSPIDHYLQMVGLMPNSIEQQPTAPIELATLNTPSSTFQDMDTDMLDMVTINHFENPLIEEHKTPHLDQYGFQEEHAQLEVNPNDDDLLHSALNDMHNQM